MFLHIFSLFMVLNRTKLYPQLAPPARSDRILIVAPHIDDEAIAAGGYALDAIANGAEVYVVYLTAGDCNRFSARLLHRTLEPTASNYLAVGKTRIAEARNAMKLLGIPPDHLFVLGYPDRGLRAMVDNPDEIVRSRGTHAYEVPYDDAFSPGSEYKIDNAINDLKQVIERTRPTTVIAPVPFDQHPDHAATAEIVDYALDELQWRPMRLGYLVHTSRMKALVNMPERALLPPSRMKEFSWAMYPLTVHSQRIKTDVLMAYKSQRPYTLLLRNTFVRRNELFFVYPTTVADEYPEQVLVAR
ncbi:MAG TPA: PIG-L family deacetylase [Thermoanaerobaculia bacterium]|nr:PIG-L family deacetylase [Thermoanaerobaculia bacterium]